MPTPNYLKKIKNIPTNLLNVPNPSYVYDEAVLEKNARILEGVQRDAGMKILVALKGYSMWRTFPVFKNLAGGSCSGLHEARLAKEELGGEVHVHPPVYEEETFDETCEYSTHLVINSLGQWKKFGSRALSKGKICGFRLNPNFIGSDYAHYAAGTKISRFGLSLDDLKNLGVELPSKGGELGSSTPKLPEGVTGFHIHAICEKEVQALEDLMEVSEKKFGKFFAMPQITWVNFGGGHHITKKGYGIPKLIKLIKGFKKRYPNIKDFYLEPGEAIGWEAGSLVVKVLDIIERDKGLKIAILNFSAQANTPDVIIAPYTPDVFGAKTVDKENPPPSGASRHAKGSHVYVLSCSSCLSKDNLGTYAFSAPLEIGDVLIIMNTGYYTIEETNFFNGIRHPDLAILRKDGKLETVRKFTYEDFKNHLG